MAIFTTFKALTKQEGPKNFGMLVEFGTAAYRNKRHVKNEHPNKRLVLLNLSQL